MNGDEPDAAALVRMLRYLVLQSSELSPPSKALEDALQTALERGMRYQQALSATRSGGDGQLH